MSGPDPDEVAEAKFLLFEATDEEFEAWLNDEEPGNQP